MYSCCSQTFLLERISHVTYLNKPNLQKALSLKELYIHNLISEKKVCDDSFISPFKNYLFDPLNLFHLLIRPYSLKLGTWVSRWWKFKMLSHIWMKRSGKAFFFLFPFKTRTERKIWLLLKSLVLLKISAQAIYPSVCSFICTIWCNFFGLYTWNVIFSMRAHRFNLEST